MAIQVVVLDGSPLFYIFYIAWKLKPYGKLKLFETHPSHSELAFFSFLFRKSETADGSNIKRRGVDSEISGPENILSPDRALLRIYGSQKSDKTYSKSCQTGMENVTFNYSKKETNKRNIYSSISSKRFHKIKLFH